MAKWPRWLILVWELLALINQWSETVSLASVIWGPLACSNVEEERMEQ